MYVYKVRVLARCEMSTEEILDLFEFVTYISKHLFALSGNREQYRI